MQRSRYWAHVRNIEAGLPRTVVLVAIDRWNPDEMNPRMVEASSDTAARDIANGTHRVACEAEQEAFYATRNAKREAMLQQTCPTTAATGVAGSSKTK